MPNLAETRTDVDESIDIENQMRVLFEETPEMTPGVLLEALDLDYATADFRRAFWRLIANKTIEKTGNLTYKRIDQSVSV